MDCSVGALIELKIKIKKHARGGNFTPTYPASYTPKTTCINFGLWIRVLNLSIVPNFNSIGSAVSELQPPSSRKSLSPRHWLEVALTSYNSVRTNVLHCDYMTSVGLLNACRKSYLNHWQNRWQEELTQKHCGCK